MPLTRGKEEIWYESVERASKWAGMMPASWSEAPESEWPPDREKRSRPGRRWPAAFLGLVFAGTRHFSSSSAQLQNPTECSGWFAVPVAAKDFALPAG